MGLIKNFVDYTNNTTDGKHQIHLDAIYDMVNGALITLRSILDGKAASVHTHSGIVGEYPTEYVKIENNQVKMQGDGVEIYASDQQGGNINLKVSQDGGGSITASIYDQNIGKLNNVLAGTIPQSDVSGLSDSLAGKANNGFTEKVVSSLSPTINVDELTNGNVYLIKNSTEHYQLENILVCTAPSHKLKLSIGSETLSNNYIMIRYFNSGSNYHFIELVGTFN